MIQVFLVDDHEIVRRGLVQLLESAPGISVAGEAATAREALRRIAATAPDVAVLDVRLPDSSGIDLCRTVRSRHPEVACLMLTAYDDDEALRTAALAGASGYVLKEVRGASLVDAIRTVAGGGMLQTHEKLRRAATTVAPGASFEPDLGYRERQVLDLIAEGLTNRQIGERLGIAEKTVKNYVSGLLAKLGMSRRTQAAVYGAEQRRR